MDDKPDRVLKVVEMTGLGDLGNRVAYVLDASRLPEPQAGMRWTQDQEIDEEQAAKGSPWLRDLIQDARLGKPVVLFRWV